MKDTEAIEPNYGNWVSKRLIYLPGFTGAVILILSVILTVIGSSKMSSLLFDLAYLSLMLIVGILGVITIGLPFTLLALIISGAGLMLLDLTLVPLALVESGLFLFLVSIYFAYARRKFSSKGGDIQVKILKLLLSNFDWSGKGQALDIGCGNGPLTIELAKKFPKSHVTGVDYWGGNWEYSRSVCETNSRIEGVADRVDFRKASALKLPFEDESFDAEVSNLVFHEVKDAKDKRDIIKEAFRILKKGGSFAFQDLFLIKSMYGEVNDLLKLIRSWGIKNVEFLDTSHSSFIPRPLRIFFMLGTIGILYGRK
jgi:SAM-dependent methyltransferase